MRRPAFSPAELSANLDLFAAAVDGSLSAMREVSEFVKDEGDDDEMSRVDNMELATNQILSGDPEVVEGARCGSCGGGIVFRKLPPNPQDKFPYGCPTCGNLDEEHVERASLIARLLDQEPRAVRRAGVALVTDLVSALEKRYASGELYLRRADEKPAKIEEQDPLARWFERRGLLEGLAVRLPALKKGHFATVLEDLIDLAAELAANGECSLTFPARGDAKAVKKAILQNLAGRIRAELAPKEVTEICSARLSDDRAYRFLLARIWDPEKPPMLLFGLNPSTADEEKDDQTIRRGRTLGKREGRGSLLMLNLYGFRATHPAELKNAPEHDPVGSPVNDEVILDELRRSGPKLVVCAWGSLEEWQKPRARAVVEMIRDAGHEPMCFGRTKDGSPRHPSRLPNSAKLEEYHGEEISVRWFKCTTCQDVGCSNCL